jgi:chemotaxis response regulator CheB
LERLARAVRLAGEAVEPSPTAPPLVAIGASTGGPPAVARILGALPPGFGHAVVVAQHVDPSFSAGLVAWLDGQTPLPVRRARPGDRPAAGTVYVAAADAHLFLTPDGVFSDLPNGAGNGCIPSVDLLFWSLAGGPVGVAALLTGMGRDGAEGLLTLRRAGWHTIAQDENSSAVYGMPRVARDMDAAAEVLALAGIAPAIVAAVARRTESA